MLEKLPEDLPQPVDDGAADHLTGAPFPKLHLPSTSGEEVCLSALHGRTVVYVYPMTGKPGVPLSDGWEAIPGARGCTPQSCAFRDRHDELQGLGVRVFGLSVQDTAYQQEARDRLHLPFDMLSDQNLQLKKLLMLPTFEAAGGELYKRLTLILRDGVIEQVFYPVFPPDTNAAEVVSWLRTR